MSQIAFAPIYSDQNYLNSLTLLPKSLTEALDALEADREWAEAALGRDIVKWYLLNKRHEVEHFSVMDEDVRKREMVKMF